MVIIKSLVKCEVCEKYICRCLEDELSADTVEYNPIETDPEKEDRYEEPNYSLEEEYNNHHDCFLFNSTINNLLGD